MDSNADQAPAAGTPGADPAAPRVSVVIVCHNDGRWLTRCLESLHDQTIVDQIEVIIADNSSTDGTDRLARKLIAGWANAIFLPTGGDNGFGVACNCAAERARGKYLYLLNPDTWLEPDCLQRLYETAEVRQAGVCGGWLLEYDGPCVQGEAALGFDFCGNGMPESEKRRPEQLLIPAAFFFVQRDLFLRVGMMDCEFFLYGEEMDLSWRIWVSGEKIVPAREARIHHRGAVNITAEGTTAPQENRTSVQRRFLANRNRLLFIAKDCQHLLLLMLLPCAATILAEGMATWMMTRNWSLAKATSLEALASAWRLRHHILAERRRIRTFRRRGDLWMLRFFRLGFGRWGEISKAFKQGFPRFK